MGKTKSKIQISGCKPCGTCEPCKKYNLEYELAVWCDEQKKEYHAGTLSEDKIKMLEAIPKWTWKLDE